MSMKRTLYVLALGVFGISTTEFGVIGILPKIAKTYNITVDKAGWLLSAFALIIALFGPFMTLIFSRMNRKKALIAVLAIFTISNLISMVAGNFAVLLLARILPAFLHPVFWSIALAVAGGSVSAADSPKAVSIVFGGFTIASVLGVPLGTFMADLLTWRSSFLLCAIVNLISMIGLILLLPSMPAGGKASVGQQTRILRRPALWIQLGLACCMIAAMYASYGYLSAYLNLVTNMSGAQVSLMFLIFGLAGVGGNWLAGKMLSKNIPLTTIVFIGLLAGVHVLVFWAGPWFVPMVIIICLWGFIHTGGFLISNVNVTSAAPDSPEFVNSIFTSCGNLAVTIGASAGGFTIAYGGGIRLVACTSIILLLLASFVWLIGLWFARAGKRVIL
jgi:MFS transporter, DHA1 family, inner membrane transport protein